MVSAHEIEVFIPEDHRLTVEVPRSVRSGPARLILLVASEDLGKSQDPKALERWQVGHQEDRMVVHHHPSQAGALVMACSRLVFRT